jgi:hypothetical protein
MSKDCRYGPTSETDQVIAAVLADMSKPGQRAIIVDSPPGAGKTTLVTRAATELAASRGKLHHRRSDQQPGRRPDIAGSPPGPGLALGEAVGHRLHPSPPACLRFLASRSPPESMPSAPRK